MIPQRIQLHGFLSYKDEQEVRFAESPLWLLAGLNGTGKSAVFDGITYALFGHHRAGSQEAQELINKDSDGLVVEFDFLLDGQAYRIKRTLKRSARGNPAATRQVFRRDVNGNGTEGWKAIDGTRQAEGFKKWVEEHIGLDYKTFTSSVLLLQGQAEKLLNSGPKDRFEVLAGIVDLERYRRLHARADELRRAQDERVKGLKNHLEALPEVDVFQLAEAGERIARAEAARDEAVAAVERLQGLEFQARQWADLQGRLGTLRQRGRQYQAALDAAADIERDAGRLRELREVLPRLQDILKQRQQIADSERKTKDLLGEKQKLASQLGQNDHARKQADQQRKTLLDQIINDEARHREVAAALGKAKLRMAKLEEYERHEADLARLLADLARLPADPAGAVARARERHDHLTVVDRAAPLLARLQGRRDDLLASRKREQEAGKARQAVQLRGEQLTADIDRLKPQLEEAAKVLQLANDQATTAKTLWQQAREQLREVTELDGAKVCRHCGQALTAGHLAEEKRRREKVVAEAEARHKHATVEQQKARRQDQDLRTKFDELEKKRQAAREDYREHRTAAEQARRDMDRLQAECGEAHAELPEPFRSRVSPVPVGDWAGTPYPTATEVESVRLEAAGLATARKSLRDAEDCERQWNALKLQDADKRRTLDRLQADLPADRQAVRQEHVRLESEEQALDRGLAARRAEEREVQNQLDRLARERERMQQQLAGLDSRLSEEEATQRHGQQALTRLKKELPPAWQPHAERVGLAELNAWHQERDDLVKAKAEERGQELQQARAGLEVLRHDLADLEARQEQYPPEARQEPARIQDLLKEAKLVQRQREDERSEAMQHRGRLEDQRQKRQQLVQEMLEAEKEYASHKLLADLLGRDRLQLHLVRQAERQVVDHANAVLDRLSSGQLSLRLVGEAGGEDSGIKALELEAYNRVTGERPINVAFLSGSQKFRVAVSLALGIGQYASRQHRPIESVIIDEGFGCLDRHGRQVMIQELQNLRGQMRCILLVSHQEEFVDAFADGYRFELDGGTTRVTRFQR